MIKKGILVFMYSKGYSCQILMKLGFSRYISEKSSNTKFHENRSSGSRVLPCGRTDMTKLIVALHNFAKLPKNVNHEKKSGSQNEKFLLLRTNLCKRN